ncbi:TSUP family transporter [Niabella yanshanensis]|uniref:Probable membrane transporter protein n=1 Tax=Niabella yanshanensis TaxID=577386 RepID=A0ABZ0WD79_9BACT|nr:TSUP family transporter [Niabella yanshanensis]WQD40651.1 TSUP family transporter [Niabella yanshanensis]
MSESAHTNNKVDFGNNLFPVFIKLEQLKLLIIGGGNIGLEKLQAVIKNAPATQIKLVAIQISDAVREFTAPYNTIVLEERAYQIEDIQAADLVIAAVNDLEIAQQVRTDTMACEKLVNVADKPELCDFYLGSVVKKGNLKIAISTNGKSPTIAKRLKETLNETIPDEIDEVLDNMQALRNKLSGDFDHKVKVLNSVTRSLVENPDEALKEFESEPAAEIVESADVVAKAQKSTNWYLIILGIVLLVGLSIYALYAFDLVDDILLALNKDHHLFYWMLLTGFLAEIVAGSMGMGYGVICTTILLMLNVPPPVVSASIHSAESFTTAAGSISHFRLGNVNKKLIKALALPAIIGAVIGALLLTYVGEKYAAITKPFIAAYTLYLGVRILTNVFKSKERKIEKKKTNIPLLGLVGGFIDSFGGGGWGPLVTGTFIKNGRTPRYVVGSSTVAKFILTVTSAITFIFTIGIHHWNIVAGLLIGGIVTAPFSAMLTSRLPVKKMFLVVGVLVIVMSLITICKALFL